MHALFRSSGPGSRTCVYQSLSNRLSALWHKNRDGPDCKLTRATVARALGLCLGALGLRGRSVSVFADSIGAILLLVSGANVPFERLPAVVRTIASGLPLTHGIAAARLVAAGAAVHRVGTLLTRELVVGVAYLALGLLLVRAFEHAGRTSGALDRF